MRVQIRAVRREDLARIHALEQENFPGDPWSTALLLAAIQHAQTVFYVAEEDTGTIAGYCVLRTFAGEGSLDNICVDAAFRQKGVAGKLLASAERIAKEQYGAMVFTLEVRVSNAAARAFYEKNGYLNRGIRPGYYDKPREDAVIYRKQAKDQSDG